MKKRVMCCRYFARRIEIYIHDRRFQLIYQKIISGGVKMSEKILTPYQQQKITKPAPEDIIPQFLGDDLKNTALNFIAWLRENKMSLRWGPSSANSWTAYSRSKPICTISLWEHCKLGHHRDFVDSRPGGQPCWVIAPKLTNLELYNESIFNENLQDFVWDNAKSCVYSERNPNFGMAKAPGCNPNKHCRPGMDITVLGKVIKYNCGGFALSFGNPDETTLIKVKRLLELEKQARLKKS